MFGLFKSLLGNSDNEAVKTAIQEGALLVDVRTPLEFASGSVPGAINIPLDRVAQNLSSFKNKKHIVVFCRSGNRSAQAKQVLESNGITNVINGGTWQAVAEMTK